MSESQSPSSKVRDVVDAVKGVAEAVPVYQDALQPAAREIGKNLETVAKTIGLALLPLKGLIWGAEEIQRSLLPRLAEKLRSVPPEKIQQPDLHVVGPAVEALRFVGPKDELRELYANLIAGSLDKDRAYKAHPAFAAIIKELSPDEARVMRLFGERRVAPLLNVERYEKHISFEGEAFTPVARHVSSIGEDAGCDHPELATSYLDNLSRLGLITLPDQASEGPRLHHPAAYQALESSPIVEAAKRRFGGESSTELRYQRRIAEITSFGRQFCEACVFDAHEAALAGLAD